MASILYVGTHGSDDPTLASMPFHAAVGAIDAGHEPQVVLVVLADWLGPQRERTGSERGCVPVYFAVHGGGQPRQPAVGAGRARGKDDAAFTAHGQAPHFARWREAAGQVLAQPAERTNGAVLFPSTYA